MCKSQEVLDTVVVPAIPDDQAWVRPTFQPARGTQSVSVDASGVAGESDLDLSCVGWTSFLDGTPV